MDFFLPSSIYCWNSEQLQRDHAKGLLSLWHRKVCENCWQIPYTTWYIQYNKSSKVFIQVKNSDDLIKLARKKFCSRVKLLIMLLLNFVYFSKKEYYFVMTLVENRDNMITNFNSSVNSNSLTERKLFWSRAFSLISKYIYLSWLRKLEMILIYIWTMYLISKNINKHFGSPNNGYCICKVLIAQCTLHYNSVVL